MGYAVAQLVKALLYKPEDRGLDSQWGNFGHTYGRPMVRLNL